MAPRNPNRPRPGVVEIVVGALIALVGLAGLGVGVVALVWGQLEFDLELIAWVIVGVVVVIALVASAVRLAWIGATTRVRASGRDPAPTVEKR